MAQRIKVYVFRKGKRARTQTSLKPAYDRNATIPEIPKGGIPLEERVTEPGLGSGIDDLADSGAVLRSFRGLSKRQLAEMTLLGHKMFESGKYREARLIFEGLVAAGTKDSFAHTMLGTTYLALGDKDRALALFEASLHLDPHDLAARVYRGEIRLERRKYDKAISDLRQAVKQGPANDPFAERAQRLLRMAESMARKQK